MSDRSAVSVVIPVFNGERYLAEAVASVMEQTHGDADIVVVDDGSTDRSAEIAESLPVRLIRQPNAGPAAAMNAGVAVALGEYLAFLSADDRWATAKVARQMAALGGPGDMVFGHVQHFLCPSLTPEQARSLRCPADPIPARSAGTMLIRADDFREVGPFDERFRVGEFFEWYARASDHGLRAQVLPEVVSYRRVHGSNHSLGASRTGYPAVLKAIRDRRQAGA